MYPCNLLPISFLICDYLCDTCCIFFAIRPCVMSVACDIFAIRIFANILAINLATYPCNIFLGIVPATYVCDAFWSVHNIATRSSNIFLPLVLATNPNSKIATRFCNTLGTCTYLLHIFGTLQHVLAGFSNCDTYNISHRLGSSPFPVEARDYQVYISHYLLHFLIVTRTCNISLQHILVTFLNCDTYL